MIDGSVFEGLFVRVLKPTGQFKSDLRRIGFDVDRLEAKYPEEVFGKAVEVAVRYAYPELALETAHTRIGEAVLSGYFETILGRVTSALMPILGVAGVMNRLQRLWNVAQPSMQVAATLDGPATWQIVFSNRVMSADLVASILQSALQRADQRARVRVIERLPGSGSLRAWLE
jgi:uncharacterized protein (TIGR02265 family)